MDTQELKNLVEKDKEEVRKNIRDTVEKQFFDTLGVRPDTIDVDNYLTKEVEYLVKFYGYKCTLDGATFYVGEDQVVGDYYLGTRHPIIYQSTIVITIQKRLLRKTLTKEIEFLTAIYRMADIRI